MSDLVNAIVLAAGRGTRMKSSIPKVLQPAAGLPMLDYVLRALRGAEIKNIRIVVGHQGEVVESAVRALGYKDIEFKIQKQQLGTADAVKAGDPDSLSGLVLICNGDHPLILPEDFSNFIKIFHTKKLDLGVVSAFVNDPAQFGRIDRYANGKLRGIVETKDASSSQLKIREVNTGIYLCRADVLMDMVKAVKNDNLKGEFYLTDIVAISIRNKFKVDALSGPLRVTAGVNTLAELASVSRILRRRKALKLLESGVNVIDPQNTYIDIDVQIAPGTVVYPGVRITGKTVIGQNCVIEDHCLIQDMRIADNVHVKWGSILEKSSVGNGCLIGPYARLRPETVLGKDCHIGNFVELKKVNFGSRSKANHLTYLGDADVGEDTNIGCGTITCNYAVDKKKYRTVIGSRVFVGSDSQFVAPVTVGDDAVIGSGSTITKDIAASELGIARGRQTNIPDYSKKRK